MNGVLLVVCGWIVVMGLVVTALVVSAGRALDRLEANEDDE